MNEFKKTDNGNLEYEDENGIYTLVDMGEYVGHASRDVFDKVYSCWRLMFYEGKNNNFPINISALVDSMEHHYLLIMEILVEMYQKKCKNALIVLLKLMIYYKKS